MMKTALCLSGMIFFTALANILLKLGASVPAAERPFGLFAWQSCAGVAAFGASLLIYTELLQWLPLNVAQSLGASQFIAVIVASAWFLAEPIPVGRWIGIVLIAIGIATVGLSGGGSGATPASLAQDHVSR